jgi:hypothetical protein
MFMRSGRRLEQTVSFDVQTQPILSLGERNVRGLRHCVRAELFVVLLYPCNSSLEAVASWMHIPQ